MPKTGAFTVLMWKAGHNSLRLMLQEDFPIKFSMLNATLSISMVEHTANYQCYYILKFNFRSKYILVLLYRPTHSARNVIKLNESKSYVL